MSNTTDRELLELAAKAVGISKQWDGSLVDRCFPDRVWNPLADDGDRYRLAKALKMIIEFDSSTLGVSLPSGRWVWIGWGEGFSSKTDAEAIVALAAEIGRQMP